MKQIMSEDERRLKAIESYFDAYEEYRQLDNVCHHLYADVYGNTLIEIYRCDGARGGELVLRVKRKEEDLEGVAADIATYEWAADFLQGMIKQKREALEQTVPEVEFGAGKTVS